nr:uncharacterized protein LOC127331342 [Lolium perenne]
MRGLLAFFLAPKLLRFSLSPPRAAPLHRWEISSPKSPRRCRARRRGSRRAALVSRIGVKDAGIDSPGGVISSHSSWRGGVYDGDLFCVEPASIHSCYVLQLIMQLLFVDIPWVAMKPVIPLKHSKTPKSRQKISKFKRMKERLQYKNVSQSVQEETIPLQTVPPSDEPPFDVPEYPLHDEEKSDEEDNVVEKKNNLFNRSSPMKVVRVCKGMTSKQRALISGADFSAILSMKCSKLIPELCRFLMEHFDPVACVLDFGERGKILVNVQSVVSVMAVPMGTHPVPYKQNIDATSSVLEMMGINNGRQPTLSEVEKQLERSYPADDAYLRKFIIFLMSSVFAPTTGIYVSPKCYPAVINIEAIRRLDWARFIIDILIKTANAKEKKTGLKLACHT